MARAREVLHSVIKRNIKANILKLDLSKAYDRVSWTFSRLDLLQIGMLVGEVNWIMGCIQSATFSVLINRSPSHFFRASRGLHQRFPMSPIVFLLISEGLSRLIKDACNRDSLKGFKVSETEMISHLLFIDDVFCSVNGFLRDVSKLK